MALNRKAVYPTQIAVATGYPGGAAKNKQSANDTTGTPFEAKWVNDLWGFQDAILARGQRARSGDPDMVQNSDHCYAMEEIMRYWLMQIFNPAPVGINQQNQGKFRVNIPLNDYDKTYWRKAVTTNGGGKESARLYLFQHSVATGGSEEDFIRQAIQFPMPRLKLTGIWFSFENAGDMRIRVDKRRRNEPITTAFCTNVLEVNANSFPSSTATNQFAAVPGSTIQNPDESPEWEYVLTVVAASTSGTRLSNISLQYQWIPLDKSYDTELELRAAAAVFG